jgi:head-tail adaptor
LSYVELLTQRADIQKATITRSETGEELESWATVYSEVPVLARFLTLEADVPIGLSEAVTHMVHMQVNDALLTGRWRFVIEGFAYRIVSVKDPGNRHHHYEVLSRKLEEV